VTASTLAPATSQTVTLSASLGSQRVSTTIAVILPIASFSVGRTSLSGGSSVVTTITLAPAVTTPQTVTLTSDHPEIIALPSTTIVSPGAVTRVPLHTSAVTTATPVTLTAAIGAQRVSVAVAVVP